MVASPNAEAASPVRGRRTAMLETLLSHLPMVRLRAAAALVVGGVAACTGTLPGGGADAMPEDPLVAAAREAWEKPGGAYDAFTAAGCFACHASTASPYLVGATRAEVRTTILASTVVNLDAPQSSRVLTIGEHAGSSGLQGANTSPVSTWLDAEAAATGGTGGTRIETDAINVILTTNPASQQINTIALDALGLPGAKVTFVAEALSSFLYLKQIRVEGGTMGAHLVHPLFVSVPTAGGEDTPDQLDRFHDAEVDIMPAQSGVLGAGAAGFGGFPATDKVKMTFRTVEGYQGGGIEPPGGCNVLASFVTNVKPLFMANCTGCHAGGSGAGALDMGALGTDDAAACAQTLNQMEITNIPTSPVILAPMPGNGGHPYQYPTQNAYNNFVAGVSAWATAENDFTPP